MRASFIQNQARYKYIYIYIHILYRPLGFRALGERLASLGLVVANEERPGIRTVLVGFRV